MTQHTLFGFPVGGGGGKKAGPAPRVAARSRSLFGFAFGPAPEVPAAPGGKKPTRKRSTPRTDRSTTRTVPAGTDAAYDDVNRGRRRSASRR